MKKEIDLIKLIDAIEAEAIKRGWQVVHNGDGTFALEEVIQPPPLGIHITDGIGTEDKVGG